MSREPQVVQGVQIGAPAHGGHAVARHEGRVIFVRHTAPGEVVDVALTDADPDAKFWRGDAVVIHEPSPDRVDHVWPQAGQGGVGGAELGHLTLGAQRRWKQAVLTDTMRRIGHIELADVEVAPAPGEEQSGGRYTRTRIELVADGEGRASMYRHRSHDLVAIEEMPLAASEILEAGLLAKRWKPGARLTFVAAADGVAAYQDGRAVVGSRWVRERVSVAGAEGDRDYEFRVAGTGFWQVHRAAPRILASAVLRAAAVSAGEHVLDLYAGAGLFTLPLADAVGPTGSVTAVEGDADGTRAAKRNLHNRDWVHLIAGDVARVIRRPLPHRPDVVVLDPPRAGAGQGVMDSIAALGPRRIVYVACDPAALARDAARAVARGYGLVDVSGHDLFPHTHHVEAVAVFDRDQIS